ncbi:MAG TPA: hypothetical protein VHB79_37925 [Polyangiaceae bacterium]|nr:hypothetical protein [Polyangiaceae bacterium]
MKRLALLVLASALLVVLGCAEDPDLERQGGTMPMPTPDGTAGDASVSFGGASSEDAVPFCAALKVIHDKCQRCHQDPPKNGAPVPFLTYEDTQAPYGTSEFKYSDAMIGAVEKGQMPYVVLNGPPTNIMPPVEPLTDAEKNTLLTWLKQGAKPIGGTDCKIPLP